jgi:hypothetical protein
MLSRRQFTTGLGASLALATQIPQSAPAGAAPADKRPRRTIVDAQVHLWKAETPDFKWVPGAKPQQPEPFTIERALPLMDEAAKRHPDRFAVMGRFPVNDPKAAELLPRWKEQPGMLGIRLTFGGTTWLKDGAPTGSGPRRRRRRCRSRFSRPGSFRTSPASPSAIRSSRSSSTTSA